MCSDTIRDGSDTRRIPELNSGCLNGDCNKDFRFGMHESNENYQTCKRTSRNLGIFTADQVSQRSLALTPRPVVKCNTLLLLLFFRKWDLGPSTPARIPMETEMDTNAPRSATTIPRCNRPLGS